MTRAVVVGNRGMLGRAVGRRLRADGVSPVGLDRDEIDITDPACADHPAFADAACIYNCAGYTDVDAAEIDEANAHAVNADGPKHLAAAAARTGALLVHISTDYVFGGLDVTTPIAPDAPPAPVSAYGRSKAAGEAALAASDARWLCVRTAWLFGHGGRNFVETMLRLADERDRVQVVDDQTGSPTYAEDLADALAELGARGAEGVHHCTNRGAATWCGFAQEIFRQAGRDVTVEAVTTAAFARPAPRPAYGVLDCSVTEAALGRPMRTWREALGAYLAARPAGK